MTTNFVHWYPLPEAQQHAPEDAGVFQIRIKSGLLDYPTGRSAMVQYGSGDNLRSVLAQLANERPEGDFLCRHQSSNDPAVLLEFVDRQFQQRFGVSPRWPAP